MLTLNLPKGLPKNDSGLSPKQYINPVSAVGCVRDSSVIC